uniref:Uncharacterized protein n=1 Tax=Schistosoma mansoni TaxID=6183 RepID=A0A5K4FA84_SCHMA
MLRTKLVFICLIILLKISFYLSHRTVVETESSFVYKSYGDDSYNSTDDFNNETFPSDFDAFPGNSYFSYEDTKDPFKEENITNDYYSYDDKRHEIESEGNGWYNYDFNDESYMNDKNDSIFDGPDENDKYYGIDYYPRRDRNEIFRRKYRSKRQITTEASYTTQSFSTDTEDKENQTTTAATVPMTSTSKSAEN